MVLRSFLYAFAVLVAAAAGAAELYNAEIHQFKVAFPVPPKTESRTVQSNTGPVELSRFTAKGDGLRTAVNVVSFGREPFTEAEARFGLTQSRDRQVAQVNGKIVHSRRLTLEAAYGQEVLIAFGPPDKNFQYRIRTFYAGSRQYLVSLIGTEAQVTSPKAQAFLDSFEITQ